MKTTFISENLETQLHNVLLNQMQRCVNNQDDPELKNGIKANFKWLNKFVKLYVNSRASRAHDLESTEVMRAQQLAHAYIGKGNHDFFVTCVDGRNMPTVMFSKPPHVGGVLRAPAGIVNGFMEGQKKDTVLIDYDSYVVKQIMTLLREKPGDTIYYGLDSHLGCAARTQIHTTEGGQQLDGGVRADIMSKMMIARGIVQLQKELVSQGEEVANIIPIFFSFDPTSGGVISGLELHIYDPEVAEKGFTPEILDRLAKEGKIVRTIDILHEPKTALILQKQSKANSADFRNRYSQSLLANWIATTDIYNEGKGELFTTILTKLSGAYKTSKLSPIVVKQKAKFLLKNLVTRYSIAGTDKKWPYDTHQEEMIVITDGGYAPFSDLDAFAVFSYDLGGLIYNLKLTVDLLRSFRYSGKIKDPIKDSVFSKENFSSAPVFIVNKSILRGFQTQSWSAVHSLLLDSLFSHIDWDDLAVLNWKKSDLHKFIFKAVAKTSIMIEFDDALRFIDGVYELFDRMRIMMRDKHFRQMILHGNIFTLSALVDHNRMPRYIVPFVV
jgi:hypothetical protein